MAKSTASGLGVGTSLPAGVIMPFAGDASNVPNGWILCDGSLISRTAFRDLFNAIGTAWGEGDGSSTFALPDARGRFLRGVDNGAGTDPDAGSRAASQIGGNSGDNVGTYQADAFASHNHSDTVYWDSQIGPFNAGLVNSFAAGLNPHTTFTNNSGGNETRPKNINVNYIIKV